MDSVLVGQIILFSGNFAPKDWAICDGRLLPIQNNEKLYSIIGTKYGGDGQRTFASLKMQPYGDTNFIIALEGIYPQRP
jgi:microcystin-dependent protein